MREKQENQTVVEPEFNKTERTLIHLYRQLPLQDRRYLRRVALIMAKAALKRS
ncbi:hypothetical protein [Pseudomonas sp. RIT-PI-S]|uniref:hypothetical protein n=1 Tax=Pseudomonas sp. RIT-PI-S TaxID=3035295 RepID=UPI0021D9B6A6|nr:hypothetical protein [Pseudomonas sp. RIT-PI-S]